MMLICSRRIGVTTRDRPEASPQTGFFDFGYHAIGNPIHNLRLQRSNLGLV